MNNADAPRSRRTRRIPNQNASGYHVYVPACPYCSVSPDDAWLSTDQAVVVPHANPIAPGHAVVAPRRHVATFYELDVVEQRTVWNLVGSVQVRIREGLRVSSFSVGFSDCPEGRGHTHVHVVPRTLEDDFTLPAEVEWVSQ